MQATDNTQTLFMNAKEAAAIMSVHPRTITRMCDSGALPAVRVGSQWRINREKFMQLFGLAQEHAEQQNEV